MDLIVDGQPAFIYTGGKPYDPALPTVAFIHGAQADHGAWALHTRWFAHHGFGVLAFDLPGHGRSGGAPLPSIEALADWVELALEKVSPGGTAPYVSLGGHSMGSLTALECAARHPARIARLVMIGTAVPMPVSDALLDAAKNNEAKAIDMINRWSHSARPTIGGYAVPGIWHFGANRALMARQKPGTLHNDLSACNAYAGGPAAAARLKIPVLIVSGGRDAMTNPRAAAKFAALIPRANTVTLPGTGHSIMAEQPDALLDELRRFIVAP